MKKYILSLLVAAAGLLLAGCTIDEGGNPYRTSYKLQSFSYRMTQRTSVAAVSALNQLLLDGTDINREGFNASVDGEIPFRITRKSQDCWEAATDGEYATASLRFSFSMTVRRMPQEDGHDRWTCSEVEATQTEDQSRATLANIGGDIVFDWDTRVYPTRVESTLEQNGSYRVEFFPRGMTGCLDWCEITFSKGDISNCRANLGR